MRNAIGFHFAEDVIINEIRSERFSYRHIGSTCYFRGSQGRQFGCHLVCQLRGCLKPGFLGLDVHLVSEQLDIFCQIGDFLVCKIPPLGFHLGIGDTLADRLSDLFQCAAMIPGVISEIHARVA